MKIVIALTAAATLGIVLPAAALAQTGNAPHPATKAALACLVGLGPEGCWTVFEKPAAHQYIYCTEQYVWRVQDNCPNGPLETVQYYGTNALGADVYGVNWMNLRSIYLIWPAAPGGKIQLVRMLVDPPTSMMGPLRVTSPANPLQILYTRPQQDD